MSTRILYLIRNYGIGGVQRIVQLLLTHLPQEGFELVLVPYDAGSPYDQAFIDGLLQQGINVPPDRIPWRGPQDWLRARRAIATCARKYQIDIIHTHDNLSTMLIGLGRSYWHSPCVASAYGWFEPKWNPKLSLYFRMERRFALPNFDCVYTVSQNMKGKIIAGGTSAERVQVIHTGIDVARFNTRGLRTAVRNRFGIPHDAVVVGTVSRLSAEKGHQYLLRAARLLMQTYPQLTLFLVGEGGQQALLEAEAKKLGIAERVHFAGFYEDLPAALEAMDIYTLPSILDEGFPTSAIEAQAAGLPIVASDIGGTRETINVGTSGLLVPPANPDSLARALIELLSDDERRQQMGSNARRWIQQSFPLANMIQQMTQLYRSVYGNRADEYSPSSLTSSSLNDT